MINAVKSFKINNNYIKRMFSLKIPEKSRITTVKTAMPFVALPVIAYLKPTKIRTNIRETNKNIEQANHDKPDDVTWNEKQSRRLLKEKGITKKAEQDKLMNEDGKLTDEGNKKISFKGQDENGFYTTEETCSNNTHIDTELNVKDTHDTNIYDTDEPKGFFSNLGTKMKKFFGVNDKTTPNSINEANPLTINEAEEKIRLQEDLKWIDSIDEKMCPECEEIYNAIPNEVPEGLMSDIMADIPEGFAVDNSLLKMLRKMTRDLIGE